jgi:glycosyltransferase involved in cell wall biosynthesis
VTNAKNPHVVVDARMATDGGIGTYLQNLVPRIATARPQWRFTALGDPSDLHALGWHGYPNLEIRAQQTPIFSVAEQLRVPLDTPRDATLFWAPNYNVPALLGSTPVVVTIHDVNHVALAELMGSTLRREYARWMMNRTLRVARRVLFDTEFTRHEAERLFGAVGDRGVVVHLAVSEDWKTARASAPRRPLADPYFLYLGNVKPHKNVPMLLRAFARLVDQLPHRIVLIGRREGLRADPDVARELDRLGDRALYLGEMNRRTVQQYVVHAEALVTASLYEGFGLPPLEAMAAGCPCLVSRAGSLPEVCGDAALYCDPTSEVSIAEGMQRLSADPGLREDLVARGHARVMQFSWDRAAAASADVLDQVVTAVETRA